jgi:regulator of sigma E protease
MVLTIIIAFFSLIGLMVLHELGHFFFAKRFGVKVEEFGVGYPPRIFGKKIGETIYSLNLLPFGAFVRLPGEIERSEQKGSFSQLPVSKRMLITLGGVISFWVIAAVLFSIVFNIGAPIAVEDGDNQGLINPKVQIVNLSSDSPAQLAGLKVGDVIREMASDGTILSTTKVREVQNFTNNHLGKEVALKIERENEVFEFSLVPRESPPQGEGAMGVALARTAIKKYPWYLAPWEGISATLNLTSAIVKGYGQAILNVIQKKPSGVQMTGPVGVLEMLNQAQKLGINYYLNFLGLISVYLAIFNILPIPAVDGGKMIFLGIEAVRKKPVPEAIEQRVTAAFFALLLILMVWVTINDIGRIF